jgi:citrate lyase subunit beta/citryl-CoA lyase
MGYVGRSCIHPAQVGVVNALFTPSEDEIAAAARLVAQADAAAAAGQGAFVDDAGRMVDEAIVRTARRTLEMGMR